MLRKPTIYQFDLFSNPPVVKTARVPAWQALPEETRRRLTWLMVRLILNYVDGDHTGQQGGADHDA